MVHRKGYIYMMVMKKFSITAYTIMEISPACCHLVVVGRLRTSNTRIATQAGVYSPGRSPQDRQVEG